MPSEVFNHTSLFALDLLLNSISSLPPEVSAWTSLVWLDLDHNRISSLPPEVSAWTSLVWLHLDYNSLSSLPPEVSTWTSLKELYVETNPLATAEKRESHHFPTLLEIAGRKIVSENRCLVLHDAPCRNDNVPNVAKNATKVNFSNTNGASNIPSATYVSE